MPKMFRVVLGEGGVIGVVVVVGVEEFREFNKVE
jgi:hypothetical protein